MDRLPDDALYEISRNLSDRDLMSLHATNRGFRRATERVGLENLEPEDEEQLLDLLGMVGKPYAIDRFYRENPNTPSTNIFGALEGAIENGYEVTALHIINMSQFQSAMRSKDFAEKAFVLTAGSGMVRLMRQMMVMRPIDTRFTKKDLMIAIIRNPNAEIIKMLEDADVISQMDWAWFINNVAITIRRGVQITRLQMTEKLLRVLLSLDHPVTWSLTRPFVWSYFKSSNVSDIIDHERLWRVVIEYRQYWDNLDESAEYALRTNNFNLIDRIAEPVDATSPVGVNALFEAYHRLPLDKVRNLRRNLSRFYGPCTVCGAMH